MTLAEDTVEGESAKAAVAAAVGDGEIVLAGERAPSNAAETSKDDAGVRPSAAELAALADVFVPTAFRGAPQAGSSTTSPSSCPRPPACWFSRRSESPGTCRQRDPEYFTVVPRRPVSDKLGVIPTCWARPTVSSSVAKSVPRLLPGRSGP